MKYCLYIAVPTFSLLSIATWMTSQLIYFLCSVFAYVLTCSCSFLYAHYGGDRNVCLYLVVFASIVEGFARQQYMHAQRYPRHAMILNIVEFVGGLTALQRNPTALLLFLGGQIARLHGHLVCFIFFIVLLNITLFSSAI